MTPATTSETLPPAIARPRPTSARTALLSPALLGLALACLACGGCGERIEEDAATAPLTPAVLAEAEKPLGLTFTRPERELMLADLAEQRADFERVRDLDLPNEVAPALLFDPRPAGFRLDLPERPPRWSRPPARPRPIDLEELGFATIGELGAMLRAGEVTSVELTEVCLDRLRRFDPQLEMVVSLTEDLAREQARRADREIAAGLWRGPLHGIPYGVKDLLAVAGTRTTWGAAPYRDQVIDHTATVVRRLEGAGAVLVAKLSLGALAWGDVWYGGTTRNPWRPEQGSSGSSAGPAAAVAAGCVPFAIGTETWGSIVSPSTRCGVTGLRPTFGRVSRDGAMALSWSMDKIGPIARSVEDCAIVLDAIRGPDGSDRTVVAAPFPYRPEVDWATLRVGYLAEAFAAGPDEADDPDAARGRELDLATLQVLRDLGARLVPVGGDDADAVPWVEGVPVGSLSCILSAEAGAAFERLTLDGRDDLLVRQGRYAWPNVFRASHFIPAVAYVQANRARTLAMDEMARVMAAVDVLATPSFGGDVLLLTNLTGHPCVVVPNGFVEPDQPHSFSFIGRLYDEATVLAVARAYQEATAFHRLRPYRFDPAVPGGAARPDAAAGG